MAHLSDSPVLSMPQEMPSVEERRSLIERVAASDQFGRSTRLRDFLLYIGRQSLKDGCPEVHEQEIGVRVFGRSESYDRSQDNIVRVNATELRRRVDAYFAGPGANEPLIFEIPRGAYKPVFRWRMLELEDSPVPFLEPDPKVPSGEPAEIPSLREIAERRAAPIERIVWIVICLGLAAGWATTLLQNRSIRQSLAPWPNQPAVAAFWSAFLDMHRQTDIVLPDDSSSVIEDIDDIPISLSDYVSRGFMWKIQTSGMSEDRKQDLNQIFGHNLVTFGAVRAAQAVLSNIPTGYSRYLTLARHFSADELNRSNVVFLGGAKALPWDHLFDDQTNFVADFDYKSGMEVIRNRAPEPGELPVYRPPVGPNSMISYAVIAYLPNPARTGHALILAGTDSDATGAAASFLTSEEQMSKLRSTLHVDRFPYFEVLLKTSRLSGTYFSAVPIAYRTYPNLR